MWNIRRTNTKAWLGALALVLGVGTAGAVAAYSASAGAAPAAQRTAEHSRARVTIEIPEVSCAGCSLKARKAVKAAGGIVRIGEGDPKNRIVLTYEPGPDRPAVYVKALRQAGFARAQRVAKQ